MLWEPKCINQSNKFWSQLLQQMLLQQNQTFNLLWSNKITLNKYRCHIRPNNNVTTKQQSQIINNLSTLFILLTHDSLHQRFKNVFISM